jgi:hypothetical protein
LLFFSSVEGADTTSSRPILNLRHEPLAARGNYRLHIIAGETLASEYGLYLKSGVTTLVVRVAELGAQINLELRSPVEAIHTVALDPTCKETIALSDGHRLTAVEIQSEYLALIEQHLSELPAWAPDVCCRWRRVLSCLAEDPLLLGRTLDWPIKYGIFKAYADRIDFLVDGKDLLIELQQAAEHTAFGNTSPSLDVLLGPSSPVLGKAAEINAILRRHGFRWNQLKSSENCRAQLSEMLDVRFGILGNGLFDQLDRQGLLQHRVVEDAAIERAMHEAPPGTRAYLRSQAISELAGRRLATCSWTSVVDAKRGVLDLSDPREQSARWKAFPSHNQIARRAYRHWHERGCPHGSPQIDWLIAERQLQEEFRDLC